MFKSDLPRHEHRWVYVWNVYTKDDAARELAADYRECKDCLKREDMRV